MVLSLCILNFKECIIPHILGLTSKWDKLLKHIHSSTKFEALETTEETTFLYFCFIVFLIVTLPTGSHMSQVSKQCPAFGYI